MTDESRDPLNGPRNLAELDERASRPSSAVTTIAQGLVGRILVLGAGGKMGFHLTYMLKRALGFEEHSTQLLAVSRFGNPAAVERFHQHGLATLSCDLLDNQVLTSLPDADYIFYLAGVKFGASSDPARLHQVNVLLPNQVAQRFPQANIVALSTGCVYAFSTPDSGGSTEDDRPLPHGAYAESCLGRERAFATGHSRCSIIRLNYSVDLRYGVLVDIAQKVLTGQPIDVTMGYVNAIWQGDALDHIIQSLPHVDSPPRILNVTGARCLSVRSVAQQFAAHFNTTATIVGHEAPTAWLSNASRSHQLFGIPSVDEDRLIQWVADWLKQGGETLGKPTHFEVRDGKFS